MVKLEMKKEAECIETFDGVSHDTEDILRKMHDDDFYYGYLGKNALSCSLLKTFMKSPKQYLEARLGATEETQALRDGRLLHLAVLEPEKFENLNTVEVKSKNTKAYKAAVEEYGTVYTSKEIDTALALAEVIHNNNKAAEYLEDAHFEVPAVAMIENTPFRAKADILKGNQIIDVKTTMDIKKFKYSAYKYGYDLQAYLYLLMFPEAEVFTFLCIDKATKDVAVYECSEEFLDSGRKKLEEGLAQFHFFFPDEGEVVDLQHYVHRDIL